MSLRIKKINKDYIPDFITTELPERYNWRQPKREDITIDEKSALMNQWTFSELQEANLKFHAIKIEGKMWKQKIGNEWFLFWFGFSSEKDRISINCRQIIIL